MLLSLPLYQWSKLKYALLDWFTNPKQVLLPLLAIVLVALYLKPSLYKKFILCGVCALSITYLIVISPVGAFITTQGLTLFLPPDVGQPADAIVVLGRGRLAEQERVQAAVRLWQAERAPIILTTGRSEASRLSDQLTKLGIPPDVQLIESQARTTEENATRSLPLLQTIGTNQLILVTDQPHMLRSVLTFQSFGFQVIPHPVTIPSKYPSIEKTTLALREYVGLASYALLGRFQPRTTSVATSEMHQYRSVNADNY